MTDVIGLSTGVVSDVDWAVASRWDDDPGPIGPLRC